MTSVMGYVFQGQGHLPIQIVVWVWSRFERRVADFEGGLKSEVQHTEGPGVLDELKRRNPADEKGRRKAKHFQWLTEDTGNPALAQHRYAAIGSCSASNVSEWGDHLRRHRVDASHSEGSVETLRT